MSTNIETGRIAIPEPSITRFMFAGSRVAPVWLVVRVYLGYLWITAGER